MLLYCLDSLIYDVDVNLNYLYLECLYYWLISYTNMIYILQRPLTVNHG